MTYKSKTAEESGYEKNETPLIRSDRIMGKTRSGRALKKRIEGEVERKIYGKKETNEVEKRAYKRKIKPEKRIPISYLLSNESRGRIKLDKAIKYLGADFELHKFLPLQELRDEKKGLLKAYGEGWMLKIPIDVYKNLSTHKNWVTGKEIIGILSELPEYSQ